jgi:phage terminase small subunit
MQVTTDDGHENELSVKQARFVDAMLVGANIGTAAKTAGISEATATRWQKLPIVKQQLRQARQELFEDRLSILKECVPTAIKTLVKHMSSEETAAYVQVQAATAVLNLAVELYRSDLLEDRLSQLEERLKDAAR